MRKQAFLFALVTVIAGCGGAQRPCLQAGDCGDKHACVVGVCRRTNEAPVDVSLRRLVLRPDRLAVVTSRSRDAFDPAEIPFGRESAGQVLLLLHFDAPFSPDTDVRSAFLVLDPLPDVPPSSAPVPVSVVRILSPWTADGSSWSRLPRLSPIESTWRASTWGLRPLRIDVTAIVRRWREARADDHGLALLAGPQDAFGARYATGIGHGQGPTLDIYLR
jgi:hypothetical protein